MNNMEHRVLIVDDNEDARLGIQEGLSMAGFQAETAANGQEALEAVRHGHFDVIILDLVMPNMDGREVVFALRRIGDPDDRAVIVLTAFSTTANAVALLKAGASDYLTKPFRLTRLIETVQRCCKELEFRRTSQNAHWDDAFGCMANPIRRRIIYAMGEDSALRLMELSRKIVVPDHSQTRFHLEYLKKSGFIQQNQARLFSLTLTGKHLYQCLKIWDPASPSALQ